MKVAVIQHRLRAHERMDLAALLALAQEASDDGASVIVCPAVPGMPRTSRVFQAFVENMNAHAPGSLVISPLLAALREEENGPLLTPLGRTVALLGDDCFDPGCHERLQGLRPQALVWQADAESPLQAEAVLEVALDASLSLAPLVLVAAVVGRARGVSGHGGSAIVHLGDIVAEAGDDEEIVSADLDLPAELPDRPGPLPVPPPILVQRLAHHHGEKPAVDYPADLS